MVAKQAAWAIRSCCQAGGPGLPFSAGEQGGPALSLANRRVENGIWQAWEEFDHEPLGAPVLCLIDIGAGLHGATEKACSRDEL